MADASGKARKEPKLETYIYPTWQDVPMTPDRDHHIRTLARAHATANPSDPFAFGRRFLHLKRGIESSS